MASAATPLDEVFERCREMDASLAERLSMFADAVRARAPAFSAAVDRLIRASMTAAPATPLRGRAKRCRPFSCPMTPAI